MDDGGVVWSQDGAWIGWIWVASEVGSVFWTRSLNPRPMHLLLLLAYPAFLLLLVSFHVHSPRAL